MVDLATELVSEGDDLLDRSEFVDVMNNADGTEAGPDAAQKPASAAADSLQSLAQEKYDMALKVLEKVDKEFPAENVPYDASSLYAAQLYIHIGVDDPAIAEKARPILDALWKRSTQYVTYYESFDDDTFKFYNDECMMHFSFLRYIKSLYGTLDSEKANEIEQQQMTLLETFIKKGGKLE